MNKISLGAHVGQQNLPIEELRAAWRRLEAAGLDWISAWDHFYEAPPEGGTVDHFEALATLGAMAVETKKVRLGCLVFYVGYRNPALLAKAATTLDHLSGGRFTLGLGAGWHEWEAAAYGYDFPSVGRRLDMLDEAATLIRSMLTEERTTFEGEHFRVENASCLPAPVQQRLPIYIGGIGEKRTLRIAARHGDGWNAAYVSPEEYARLNGVLDDWCEAEDRDPATLVRSVNVSFHLVEDPADIPKAREALERQWGPRAERVRAGSLVGTPEIAEDRIAAWFEAGAGEVNIALRAPWDPAALNTYLTETVPALRRRFAAG